MVEVTLNSVSKSFGDVRAVDGVNLTVKRGELFFLLGPSGCGKTTLLRIIAGFYPPGWGSICFDDRDVSNMPPHKRNTAMVFQNYALWPHMSVKKNVAYGLDVRKLPKAEVGERVNAVLDVVQMVDLAERMPGQLSGGQQQRIALARALVIEPDAVLLDEPLSNLDAKLRMEMRDEIRQIHSRVGATMIYVTHDQAEALSMADRLAVLDGGRVAQVGTPRDVYQRPTSGFVAGFIGETNLILGEIASVGESVEVNTPYGVLMAANSESFQEGQTVSVSIRPEALRVVGPDGVASGGSLSGMVESVVYLGATEQYRTKLDDGRVVTSVEFNPERKRAEVQDSVVLTARAEDVVVLKE